MMASHVVAGGVALVSGVVAVASRKGGSVHLLSGQAFTVSMLLMATTGGADALRDGAWVSVLAAAVTLHLVVTGWLALHGDGGGVRALTMVAAVFGLVSAAGGAWLAVQAARAEGGLDGVPPAPFVLLAAIALVAALADLRMRVRGAPQGSWRLARHLWRMLAALLIANASFFLGQPQVFPEPLRRPWVLALPVLATLATIPYGLWRTLRRPHARVCS